MNSVLIAVLALVATSLFILLTHTSYPFAILLKRHIRKAALFARDHHDESDISDWHWQDSKESLLFWYNWTRRHPTSVEAEYHELFILSAEGEAIDIVHPNTFWRRAIHVGLLRPRKTAEEILLLGHSPAANVLQQYPA